MQSTGDYESDGNASRAAQPETVQYRYVKNLGAAKARTCQSTHWMYRMSVAGTIFLILEIWLWCGAFTALVFLTVGIDRIDEDARGAYIFRPLLLPGILLIWPFVLWRWYALEFDRGNWRNRYLPPRKVHTAVAVLLCLAITATIAVSWTVRQKWPADFKPVKLSMLVVKINER
ncbi:MAG: hypothetical protein AAF217_09055 [Pseudomonadota bacterium]